MRVCHGENPANATYEYVLMPYATEEQLAKAYENPSYETLSNTAKLQAVRDFKTGVSAYVFYDAEGCGEIAAKNPCLVSIHRDGETYVLCVSDATHKQDEVLIELGYGINVIEKSDKITVKEEDGKTYLTFNTFFANGRRFEIRYTKNK